MGLSKRAPAKGKKNSARKDGGAANAAGKAGATGKVTAVVTAYGNTWKGASPGTAADAKTVEKDKAWSRR